MVLVGSPVLTYGLRAATEVLRRLAEVTAVVTSCAEEHRSHAGARHAGGRGGSALLKRKPGPGGQGASWAAADAEPKPHQVTAAAGDTRASVRAFGGMNDRHAHRGRMASFQGKTFSFDLLSYRDADVPQQRRHLGAPTMEGGQMCR